MNESSTPLTPTFNTVAPIITASPPPTITQGPTPPVDTNAVPCSGRPFDAFLQLKNGSIYAFRGKPRHLKGFLSNNFFTPFPTVGFGEYFGVSVSGSTVQFPNVNFQKPKELPNSLIIIMGLYL